jgi:hypothetical protein
MPFLLPALTSLFSDSMVLYLHHLGLSAAHVAAATASTAAAAAAAIATTQQQPENNNNSIFSGDNNKYDITADSGGGDGDDNDSATALAAFYYRVDYLPSLAGIRVALLLLPLFFHSYTGTALKCATFYRILYSTSLLLLLFQMLALAIMDPKSLQALVILGGGDDSSGSSSGSMSGGGINLQVLHEQQLHDLQRIWYMLLFSTMSNVCHVVLFWHVRSTAQSPHYASSFYFAIRSSAPSPAVASYRTTAAAAATSSAGLYGNHVAAVNEFVVDLRLRLNRAKKDWTKRLEDFVNHGSPSSGGNINSSNIPLKNHPLTPFRVLLSLFAYEDVLQNGKLEAVYQIDGGQSMTFYIPQLLSFLLHGAGDSLQSSSALEEWILEKCRTNVYFAHKCFWFLRAWCLEQVIVMPPPPSSPSGGATSLSSLCYTTTNRNNNKNNNNKTATSSRNNSETVLQVSQDKTNMQRSSLPPPPPPYLDQPAPSPTSTDTWDDEFNDDDDGGGGAGTSSTSTNLMTTRTSGSPTQRRTRCPSPLPPISSMTAVVNSKYGNNYATPGTSMLSSAVLATPSSTSRTTASSVLSTSLHDCLASPKAAGGGARRSSMMASTSNSNLGGMLADKFLPEERAMIERLMLRVKECGQESAHLLHYGPGAHGHHYSDTLHINPSNHHGAKNAESSTVHCSSGSEDEDSYVTATQADYDTTDDEYEDLISPPAHDNNNNTTLCQLLSSSFTTPATSIFARVQTMAIAAGQIPIHPISHEPSQRHLACLAAGRRKYGFLPLSQVMDGRRKQPLKRVGQRETLDFDQTPRFVDSLLQLAESLFRVPREQRKTELLHQLRILECDFLPSNAIYLPISQNIRHTVWRIVPEESIPLNTKERVPCLLALEVVNHDAVVENSTRASSSRRGDDNAWRSILGHMSQHRSVNDVKPRTSPLSSPWTVASAARSKSPPMEQAALASSWSPPQKPPQKSFHRMESASVDASIGVLGVGGVAGTNKNSSEGAGMSEADIVYQWRFKVRQPLRHVSLIDKVTGGLDKVHKVLRTTSAGGVATVAGTLQRSTSDELQNLVSAMTGERLVQLDDEKPAAATRLTTISLSSDSFMKEPGQGNQIISDDECILQMEEQQSGVSSLNLSRASSVGSIVSMGQWGSPTPMESPSPFNNENRRSGDDIGQQNVRRRLDRESNSSLRYGSDHDDDHAEDDLVQRNWNSNSGGRGRSNSLDYMPGHPLPLVVAKRKHNKPPPVVFRESWSNKEERVRQKSIYGEHPGWKLLPILVKAQDDLRQEQLASQLIYRMASILANENVPVWLCPYEIIALTDTGGIIEAIPDTISE